MYQGPKVTKYYTTHSSAEILTFPLSVPHKTEGLKYIQDAIIMRFNYSVFSRKTNQLKSMNYIITILILHHTYHNTRYASL